MSGNYAPCSNESSSKPRMKRALKSYHPFGLRGLRSCARNLRGATPSRYGRAHLRKRRKRLRFRKQFVYMLWTTKICCSLHDSAHAFENVPIPSDCLPPHIGRELPTHVALGSGARSSARSSRPQRAVSMHSSQVISTWPSSRRISSSSAAGSVEIARRMRFLIPSMSHGP